VYKRQWIYNALSDSDNAALHESIRTEIREMVQAFPVPAAAESPATVA